MLLKKKLINHELSEPFIGLAFGITLMIIVFLVAHFVFGLEAFS
ncbi:hypothetical protein [Halalkalibacter akibai]|nr:hypothetical protein [Halalkalibacter akibai]